MERVEFILGSSRILGIFLGIVYLSAIIILICLSIFPIFKIAGTTLLVWHFYRLLNLHVKRNSKKSVIHIWQDTTGRWGCQTNSRKAAIGTLKGDSFKSAYFLILRFRFKTGMRNIIIPVDALNREEYRTLCARLSM